jgi:hypothetical protein
MIAPTLRRRAVCRQVCAAAALLLTGAVAYAQQSDIRIRASRIDDRPDPREYDSRRPRRESPPSNLPHPHLPTSTLAVSHSFRLIDVHVHTGGTSARTRDLTAPRRPPRTSCMWLKTYATLMAGFTTIQSPPAWIDSRSAIERGVLLPRILTSIGQITPASGRLPTSPDRPQSEAAARRRREDFASLVRGESNT